MGKILLVSFDDGDESMINSVLTALQVGRKIFSVDKVDLSSKIECRGLSVSIDKREVLKNEKSVSLTFTEFEILQLLIRNPGIVFSKEQIYDIVWKEPYDGDYYIVTSHIRRIREKIEDDPSNPVYIQTVWGSGYRFNSKLCCK